MPVIIGAIADVVVTSLRDQSGVSGRLSDSSSAELTSAYYIRDVQSAAFVTTSAPGHAAVALRHRSSDCTVRARTQLGQYHCCRRRQRGLLGRSDHGRPYPLLLPDRFDHTVEHRADRGWSCPPPTESRPTVSPGSAGAEAVSGWTATDGISGITLAATESASSYSFSLVGAPRVSSPFSEGLTPGGTPAPPGPPDPMLLLGDGSGAGKLLSCGGNGEINKGERPISILPQKVRPSSPATPTSQPPTSTYFQVRPLKPVATPPSALRLRARARRSSIPILGERRRREVTPRTPPLAGGTTTYYPGVYTSQLILSGNLSNQFQSGTYIFEDGISLTGNAP